MCLNKFYQENTTSTRGVDTVNMCALCTLALESADVNKTRAKTGLPLAVDISQTGMSITITYAHDE